MVFEQDVRFVAAVETWKRLRAPFEQNKEKKHQFELLVKFDETSYPIWGLYQQAVVGDINVPKRDYMDPREKSWMWSWIHGNKRWHAWNACRGMSKEEARDEFIQKVGDLERELPEKVEDWKDDQDPRIPDQNAWVPEEEREERWRWIERAKRERRQRARLEEQAERERERRRAAGEPSSDEEEQQ